MMEMNNEITQEQTKKINRRIFAARLTGYLILGLFIPVGFLIWRFNLFQKTSQLNIGGWGVVAIIFTAIFLSKLAKQATEIVESTLAKQIMESIRKVLIPLLAVTLCLYAVGDFWKELVNFFITLTICEPIAYVLNPFPEYLKEKEKNGEKSKITEIISLFWDKKK